MCVCVLLLCVLCVREWENSMFSGRGAASMSANIFVGVNGEGVGEWGEEGRRDAPNFLKIQMPFSV